MKRVFVIGVIVMVLVTMAFCACGKAPAEQPAAEKQPEVEASKQGEDGAPEPGPVQEPGIWEGDMEGFAELYGMTAWAWAVTDWESEVPTDQMAAVAYSSPEVFDSLTMAVGSENVVPVDFAGEKDGIDDFEWPHYYARYKTIKGPVWKAEGPALPAGYGVEYFLLPHSYGGGVLPLARPWLVTDEEGRTYGYERPPADPDDIEIIESQRNGRRVVDSQMLALTEDGGRVSLFQFETVDYGLVVIAYANGDKLVTKEFTTTYITEEGAFWTSETGPESFFHVEVIMLYESDAGLVIAFTTYGPEYQSRYLLGERDGRFVQFYYGAYHHNMMEQGYTQDENGLINSEAWPALDPAELVGEWKTDQYDLTFNPDGTAMRNGEEFAYLVDGNIILLKSRYDDWLEAEQDYIEIVRAKIEDGLLYIDDLYFWPGCPVLAKAR